MKALILAAVLTVQALAGCTNADCVAAADDAHAIFLQEVAADPAAFTKEELRNERLAYAGARAACMAFARSTAQ